MLAGISDSLMVLMSLHAQKQLGHNGKVVMLINHNNAPTSKNKKLVNKYGISEVLNNIDGFRGGYYRKKTLSNYVHPCVQIWLPLTKNIVV